MRRLVILCEASHARLVSENVERFCHPALRKRFLSILSFDPGADAPSRHDLDVLLSLIRSDCPGTSEPPLVCMTRPASVAFKIKELSIALGFETKILALNLMTKERNGDNSPVPMQSCLNQCGLSLRGGAVEMLQHWSHSTIDRHAVDQWLEQFGRLGKQFKWIGEAILSCTALLPAAELGELFNSLNIPNSSALCINRDPRKTAKSGDVISNLLTKRHQGATIYTSPAEAIDEHDVTQLSVFEDGLWSGTEALGIVESLLGMRPDSRLKTPRLKDPTVLANVDLTFVYGMATDYGVALLSRFLKE